HYFSAGHEHTEPARIAHEEGCAWILCIRSIGPKRPARTSAPGDATRSSRPRDDDRKQPAIAVCDLDACSSRRTLPAMGIWRWMPDGQALAYIDLRTQSDLWAQPLDGSAPRQLTHFPADGQQIWDFDWSAD